MIECLDYLKVSMELQMIYAHMERLRFNMMVGCVTLLKTARMNNLSLNPDKIQFQVYRLQILWVQTNPRRPQTRS